jgi:hypothetical protein
MIFQPIHIPSVDHESERTENAAKGFSLLASATIAEVFASTGGPQAAGFYAAIGRRIATHVELDGATETEALVARMNALWGALGWGSARLELGDDAVLIHHHDMPQDIYGDLDGRWLEAAAALLEGAYDAWFCSLISDRTLQTQFIGWNRGVAELRYGH